MMMSYLLPEHLNGNSLMIKLKNKDWMYIVMRHDFDGKDVVVASTWDYVRSQELLGEYTQMFLDKKISQDESYFYTTTTTFYE